MTHRPNNPEAANETLLAAYRSGDQSAAAVLFHRYLVRLTALARSRLSRTLARRVDPDDVVLSAYRSFFVAAANGRITVPANDDLWPLLVVLVLRKVSRAAERQTAAQRDIAQETTLESAILRNTISHDPTPEQAAILDDELSDILSRLSEREREIVTLRLQGESERAIAESLDCSERTVRRGLDSARRLITARGGIGDATWISDPATTWNTEVRGPVEDHQLPNDPSWRWINFGDLRLEKLVGTGGMAKLYRATLRPDQRTVAVKFLRKRFWSNHRAVSTLFEEARVLLRLNHPQIVALLGAGRSREGVPFLVLPWIDGETLDAWCARTSPAVARILEVMRSLLAPIAAAHAARIVHCDLKPANLLIDRTERTFLTDFGFARPFQPPSEPPVRGGTVAFLAPEQCSDVFGAIGAPTDVYGWGASLYALLCGRPPFVASDAPGVVAEVVSSHQPAPPSRWNSSIPHWLDGIALRCLAKEPGERFESMEQLAFAVRAGEHGRLDGAGDGGRPRA